MCRTDLQDEGRAEQDVSDRPAGAVCWWHWWDVWFDMKTNSLAADSEV
jgi:hypothetical protein